MRVFFIGDYDENGYLYELTGDKYIEKQRLIKHKDPGSTVMAGISSSCFSSDSSKLLLGTQARVHLYEIVSDGSFSLEKSFKGHEPDKKNVLNRVLSVFFSPDSKGFMSIDEKLDSCVFLNNGKDYSLVNKHPLTDMFFIIRSIDVVEGGKRVLVASSRSMRLGFGETYVYDKSLGGSNPFESSVFARSIQTQEVRKDLQDMQSERNVAFRSENFKNAIINFIKEKSKKDPETVIPLAIDTDIGKEDEAINQNSAMRSIARFLEHIEDISHIFSEAKRVLKANGQFFICELHLLSLFRKQKR